MKIYKITYFTNSRDSKIDEVTVKEIKHQGIYTCLHFDWGPKEYSLDLESFNRKFEQFYGTIFFANKKSDIERFKRYFEG